MFFSSHIGCEKKSLRTNWLKLFLSWTLPLPAMAEKPHPTFNFHYPDKTSIQTKAFPKYLTYPYMDCLPFYCWYKRNRMYMFVIVFYYYNSIHVSCLCNWRFIEALRNRGDPPKQMQLQDQRLNRNKT